MVATIEKKYIEAVGRRKTAIARVRLVQGAKDHLIVNDREVGIYFGTESQRQVALEALSASGTSEKYAVSVKVVGGGMNAQAEAIRHGIARALAGQSTEFRGKLKKLGFLKRDPRAKERRKFGLKKARKSPQWSKR